MDKQRKIDDEASLKLNEFWNKFSLFPSRFSNAFFSSFWYLAMWAIAPFLVLFIPTYSRLIGNQKFWITFLIGTKEWIVVVVGLVLVAWAYVRWQVKVPLLFKWLLDNDHITCQSGNLKDKYHQYLGNFQKDLSHKWKRYIFVVIIGAVLLLYRIYAPHTPLEFFLVFSLWGLIMGLGAWPVLVTGKYIRLLPREFDITIQPAHPDKCGGLKPLGDFCFSMVLPLIIGEFILAVFGIGGALLLTAYPNRVIGEGVWLLFDGSDVLFANIALFVVALPFTFTTFLVPLQEIHTYMTKHKTKFEDEYAARALRLEQQIRIYLENEKTLDKAKIVKEQLEIMKAIEPGILTYPIWPFSRGILLKLFSPQLLGVIGTVISTYQSISTLFPGSG